MQRMSLRGGSGSNWPALGPRLSGAVRALTLQVTRRPRRFCFRGVPGLLIALRFQAASRWRASHGGVRPLLTGLTVPGPSAIASDGSRSMPDEQLTPRQSGDDPGVRPVEPVLWPGRVRAGQPPSPGGPRSCPRRTGRQYPVAGCTPMSVPPTSVPRLAHRPSAHMHYAPGGRPSQQRVSTLGGSQALSTPHWR
jgi:hypothetical protein